MSQGTVTYAIVCTGAGGSSPGSASVTATTNTSSNLTITSGLLPDGTVGKYYGQLHYVKVSSNGPTTVRGVFFQLSASGGNGQYSWKWAAAPGSSLPPHMGCCDLILGWAQPPNPQVRVQGAIAGTPIAPGTYQVVVTVYDSGSPPALTSANYTFNINYPPPPVVNTTPAPAIGTLNVAYVGSNFTVTDGLAPFTWSETGALPQGMGFSSGGVLTGTPTEAGSFTLQLRYRTRSAEMRPHKTLRLWFFQRVHAYRQHGKWARWAYGDPAQQRQSPSDGRNECDSRSRNGRAI